MRLRRPTGPVIRAGLAALVVLTFFAGCATHRVPVRDSHVVSFFGDPLAASGVQFDDVRRDRFAGGWRAVQEGRLSEAQQVFQSLLRGAPRSDTHPMTAALGVIQLASGAPGAALDSFEAALASRPGYSTAVTGRAAALHELGDSDKALDLLDRLLTDHPSIAGAARLRNRVRAIVLDRSLARARDAEFRGEHREALAAMKRAGELDPSNIEIAKRRGALALRLEESDEAVDAYRAATAIDDDDLDAWLGLGEAYMGVGNTPAARDAFERVAELPGGTEVAKERIPVLRTVERRDLNDSPELTRAIERPVVSRAGLAAIMASRLPMLKRVGDRRPVIMTDVSSSWARAMIQDLVALGVLEVYENHMYRPGSPSTRVMVARAVASVLAIYRRSGWLTERPGNEVHLVDIPPEHLYHGEVRQVLRYELMTTSPGGEFRPFEAMSGREVTEVMERLDALRR